MYKNSARFLGRSPYLEQKVLAESPDVITYLARRPHHDGSETPVVIKELHLGQLTDWKHLELMQREAQILAHLRHPRIPRLLDYFAADKGSERCYYLVTAYLKSQNLQEKYRAQWLPTEAECLELAAQVLEILVYLQAFHPPLIHRDLKPSNLLLDDSGQIHLIDFGAVQGFLAPTGSSGSTTVGTPGYMAPEQFWGRAGPASDLYGLGATLVYLLTGRCPNDLPRKEGRLQYRGFTTCSLPFLEWLDFLLFLEPEDRFESAESALQQLDQLSGRTEQRHLHYPRRMELEALDRLSLEALQAELSPQVEGAPEAKEELPPQERILGGRYALDSVVGRGTRTVVYRAHRVNSGARVVIKELNFRRLHNWKELELFKREAETLSELKHPAIPRLLDWIELRSEDNFQFYMVSEEIAGQTLLEKMAVGWHPEKQEVWQLALQLLEILVYLQDCHPPIYHRDIKPSNLLLDAEHKLHLLDFGAVQNRFRPQGSGGSTVLGSVGYMAPEQFVGRAGDQTDLYATGATLVHLLSGRHPAEFAQENGHLDFAAEVYCASGLQFWLEKMLAPDPQQRYRSAREAQQALRYFFKRPERLPEAKSLRGRNSEILPRIQPGTEPELICERLLAESEIWNEAAPLQVCLPASKVRWRKRWPLLLDLSLAGSFLALWSWSQFWFQVLSAGQFWGVMLLFSTTVFALGFLRSGLYHWLCQRCFPTDLLRREQYLCFSPVGLTLSAQPQSAAESIASEAFWSWNEIQQISVTALPAWTDVRAAQKPLQRLRLQGQNSSSLLSLSFSLSQDQASRLELCLQALQKYWLQQPTLERLAPARAVQVRRRAHKGAVSLALLTTPVLVGFCSTALLSGLQGGFQTLPLLSGLFQTHGVESKAERAHLELRRAQRAARSRSQPPAETSAKPYKVYHPPTLPQYQWPTFSAPQYQAPQYQPPTYTAPRYQPPSYPPPTYRPPTYQAPAYQAPAYQAPVYRPPSYQAPVYRPPSYQAPVYRPPSYQAPTYQAPVYRPPTIQAPQVPVYRPPTYRTPNYQAPGK